MRTSSSGADRRLAAAVPVDSRRLSHGGQDNDVDEADLIELLEGVRSGRTAPEEAVARLRRLPFADLGHSRIDHHRALRQGMAEAVYGPGQDGRGSASRT